MNKGKKRGITHILNKHYNDHQDDFIFNNHSTNLKTVQLKIGERPKSGTIEEYINSLPRYKQARAKGIKKLSTQQKRKALEKAGKNWSDYKLLKPHEKSQWLTEVGCYKDEAINDTWIADIEKRIEDLIKLDNWFEGYEEIKQSYFENIWNLQGGETATIESICELTGLSIGGLVGISEKENKDDTTNTDILHKFVRDIVAAHIPSQKFAKPFLANLWTDVASDYLGYIKQFKKAIDEFDEKKTNLSNLLKDCDNTLKLNESNPYEFKTYREASIAFDYLKREFSGKKAHINNKKSQESKPEYKSFCSITKELDFAEYNRRYRLIKKALFQLHSIEVGINNNPERISSLEELCKMFNKQGITKLTFDHERTFPFVAREIPTPQSLVDSILQELGEFEKNETNLHAFEKSSYGKGKIHFNEQVYKHYYTTHPFQINEPGKPVRNIPSKELSPQAIARRELKKLVKTENQLNVLSVKVFREYMDSQYAFCISRLDKSLKKLENLIVKNSQEGYLELRNVANWLELTADCVLRKCKTKIRDEFKIKVNHATSRIQGLWSYIEPQPKTQSIYLSGMYRKFGKGCSYLCTDKAKHTLSLLVGFKQPIQQGDDTLLGLGYVNKQGQILDDPTNSQKYKEYNTPKLSEIRYSSSDTFCFPLQFGSNQSRKYFWNTVRKQGEGDGAYLVHHIFEPQSRLKVSSMRLIKKYNAKREVWEYYLNLAIYRLEESHVDIKSNNNFIGVDIGENTLISTNGCDFENGEEKTEERITSEYEKKRLHVDKINHNISTVLANAKIQQTENNYIDSKTRRTITNKSDALKKQVAAHFLKSALKGKSIVFEEQYSGDKKSSYVNKKDPTDRLVNYLKQNVQPTTYSKVKTEVSYSKLNTLISKVPTDNTSQICSQCGHIPKNYIDYNKFFELLNSDQVTIELRNLIDTSKLNNDILSIETFQKAITRRIHDTSIPFTFTFTDDTQVWRYNNNGERIDFKDKNAWYNGRVNTIIDSRPAWYYKNSETFRCLICGHTTPCDEQAALTIARYNLFLNEKVREKIVNNKPLIKKINDQISKIPKAKTDAIEKLNEKKSKLEEPLLIRSENLSNFAKDFQPWYQANLQQFGYDENGYSKWNNIPPKV